MKKVNHYKRLGVLLASLWFCNAVWAQAQSAALGKETSEQEIFDFEKMPTSQWRSFTSTVSEGLTMQVPNEGKCNKDVNKQYNLTFEICTFVSQDLIVVHTALQKQEFKGLTIQEAGALLDQMTVNAFNGFKIDQMTANALDHQVGKGQQKNASPIRFVLGINKKLPFQAQTILDQTSGTFTVTTATPNIKKPKESLAALNKLFKSQQIIKK